MWDYYVHTTLGWIELIACLTTVICVFQLTTQNIWNFFWGILGCVLYGYLFYSSHLFADFTLQIAYFLPIQFYGLWYWYYQGDAVFKNTLVPRQMSKGEQSLAVLVTIFGTGIAWVFYANFTSASYPGWDSFILAASVVAQFLLSKKITENWMFWIAVDLVAVPLYYAKELYVTSALYAVLLILCIKGLLEWMDSEIVEEVEENV